MGSKRFMGLGLRPRVLLGYTGFSRSQELGCTEIDRDVEHTGMVKETIQSLGFQV